MAADDRFGQPPKRRQSSRDFQRSAVYAWEDQAGRRVNRHPCFERLEDCQDWLDPIWRAERGRYGRARVPTPLIERPSWGQRSAIAHYDHRITLPR